MANIFLMASGSRSGTRRAMKSKNPEGKRSNSNPSSNSDNNFSCKKHTKHRQSPGVCSICLTERLSKVSLEYYNYTKNAAQTASSYCSSTASSSTSVSSCYSSSSVSSCSSPLQYRYRETKKDGKKHSLFRLLLGSIVD